MLLSRRSALLIGGAAIAVGASYFFACAPTTGSGVAGAGGDAASRVYVAPGNDDYYAFLSGGFSGQLAAYGIPSGRLLKVIPVFSQNPENGYGYKRRDEGDARVHVRKHPWDDTHHPSLSVTDGRRIFINGNNTPRIARIDLGNGRRSLCDRCVQLCLQHVEGLQRSRCSSSCACGRDAEFPTIANY